MCCIPLVRKTLNDCVNKGGVSELGFAVALLCTNERLSLT